MVFRKWKKQKYEKEIERKRKEHEKLDRAYKKRMKKGYEEGLRQNLQFRAR
ncbi:MAG: hypothetical protein ACTSUP_02525 [Candidatus Heimdallarchaeaceae archaeon]